MKDILPEVYEQLRKSDYPVFIWGAGIMSKKVEMRLEEQGIRPEGFFVDIECENGSINTADGDRKVYSLSALSKMFDKIDVVVGHGHYEKRDDIARLPFVHKVYIIANPYVQYRVKGLEEWLKQNRAVYEDIAYRLADDVSREMLHAYCMVNMTNDINYLLKRKSMIIRDMFDFEELHLTETETFLDVGAWTGDTINIFLDKTGYKYQHIYAVEPEPDSYRSLQNYVKGMENISLYSCGLGAKAGNWFLDEDEESTQSTTLTEQKIKGGQACVEVKTIDELFENIPLSLIKICVPFIFPDILRGAERYIRRYRPRLIINVAIAGSPLFFDTIQWLLNLEVGYHIALRMDMPIATRLWLYAY